MAKGTRKQTYAYGKHYKPCPWSQNKIEYYNGQAQRYIAYCTNDSNPYVVGHHATKVTNDELATKCIGRCLDGKNYTSCPYYRRMNGSERKVKKKSDKRFSRRMALFGDPMLIFFIIAVLLALYGMSK